MVIGKFKDEVGGLIIEEFVGLRSKLYSLSLWEKKRRYAKESREKYLKIMLVLMTIKKCLLDGVPQMREMNLIRNHGHKMYTETVNKVALSANGDKRIIREDGNHSYAYVHYATLSSEEESVESEG